MNQRIKNTCIMYDNDLIEYYYSLPGKIMALRRFIKHTMIIFPQTLKILKLEMIIKGITNLH